MSDNYFKINDENRQHISLSSHAIKVIETDMIRFCDDYELKNRSGFMNVIISNYYDQFPLSRNVALKQITAIQTATQKANNTLDKQNDFSRKLTDKIIDEFSEEIMKSIISEYSNKFDNDYQFKLKVNIENVSLLESLEDSKYFNNYAPRSGISFFIKIILECYAILSREERERIFYRQTIDEIEKAIKNNTFIKYKDNENYVKVSPRAIYKPIKKESLEVIYYKFDPDGDDDRIIDNITVKSLSRKGVRFLKEKDSIGTLDTDIFEKTYRERETQSNRPIETFTVKFSPGGLNRYIYEEDRLPIIGIQDQNNKFIYTFKTTETNLFFHLFKFGSQVEVISPAETRERFKKLYKAAYEVYIKEIERYEK